MLQNPPSTSTLTTAMAANAPVLRGHVPQSAGHVEHVSPSKSSHISFPHSAIIKKGRKEKDDSFQYIYYTCKLSQSIFKNKLLQKFVAASILEINFRRG